MLRQVSTLPTTPLSQTYICTLIERGETAGTRMEQALVSGWEPTRMAVLNMFL